MSVLSELKTHLVHDLLVMEEMGLGAGISENELVEIETTYAAIYDSISYVDREIK